MICLFPRTILCHFIFKGRFYPDAATISAPQGRRTDFLLPEYSPDLSLLVALINNPRRPKPQIKFD